MTASGSTDVERVTVMYSTTGTNFDDCSGRAMSWRTVSTDDHGGHWSDSPLVAHSDPFRWCIPDADLAPGASPIFRDGREYSFALDPTTREYWAATTSGGTVSISVSQAQATWRHVVDLTNVDGQSSWLPAIGVDDRGHIAITYYATDSIGHIRRMLSVSAVGAADLGAAWTTPLPISSAFLGTGAENEAQSDYQTIFAVPSGTFGSAATFVAAWPAFTVVPLPGIDHLYTASISVAP